jgi:dTDP-glucose pyrophosphorylase
VGGVRQAGAGDAVVRTGTPLRDVIEVMTKNGKQVALVADADAVLRGLVTDGDIRKGLLRGVALDAAVDEVMNRRPIVATAGIATDEALAMMRGRGIRHLPVVDGRGAIVDLLFADDLLAPPPLRNRAVIMAGGEGKRLMPLTESVPKPLITVGGKPIVEILIGRLRQCGITQVTLAVHHKSSLIRERLGDGARLGVQLDYVEESSPLGTMGALTLVRDRLDQPFFVVNADILTKCDFRAMWDFHRGQRETVLTVGVSLHQVSIPYGEFTLSGTRVTQLEEKPRKEFAVNAGIYVLDPSVIDVIPAGRYFDATDLIRALLERGRVVSAYLIRDYWLDVGQLHDLEKANQDVVRGLLE